MLTSCGVEIASKQLGTRLGVKAQVWVVIATVHMVFVVYDRQGGGCGQKRRGQGPQGLEAGR